MTTQSAQLQIQQAITAALQASPQIAGGRVRSNSVREVSALANTSINVTLLGSAGISPSLGAVDWRTSYQIDCQARASATGADPAEVVDQLLCAVYARLTALGTPPGLGLVNLSVDPQIKWDYADGATPLVAASLFVSAEHRTPAATLEPWP